MAHSSYAFQVARISENVQIIQKNILLAFQHSNIINQYLCYNGSRYIRHTSQRVKQHVPKSIKTGQFSKD